MPTQETAGSSAAAIINVGRVKVDCQANLKIHTDGPIKVTLAGCGRIVRAH